MLFRAFAHERGEMLLALATKIFGSSNERVLKNLYRHVDPINALEKTFEGMSDSDLRAQTDSFRQRLANGEPLDNLIDESFAIVREAAKRTLGQRHFDVQLVGGLALHEGKIAEMRTGEGKTLVATLPVYLNALSGKGVHVVTVNDYLAKRDAEWMGQVYNFLGLSVGCITSKIEDSERKAAYACDITYGTNNELGFDYLRDNMKYQLESMVQRAPHFAIVDEVDSILIDEARTPLIISGAAHESQPRYDLADRLAAELLEKQRPWQEQEDRVQRTLQRIKGLEGDIRQVKDKARVPELQQQLEEAKKELPGLEAARDKFTQYYEIKLDRKQVHLSHDGIATAQKSAGVGSFYVGENTDIPHLLEQSLRAHAVYQRDRDYASRSIS